MSELLVLLAIVIAASSGVPGLILGRYSMRGQWATTLVAVLAAGVGLSGVGAFWATGESHPIVSAVVDLRAPSSAWHWTVCRPSSCCRSS